MTDTPSSGYVSYPGFEQDPGLLAERAYQYIRDNLDPNWNPAAGNLETILVEALSQQAADLADTATTVTESIFEYFGQSLLGLEPKDPTSASAFATWTMIDNAGYTIEAGRQVVIGDIAFEVVDEFTISAGDTTQADVVMSAVEEGTAGNGLTGPAELVDPLNFVDSVELTTTSTGGADGEADEEYLDRLANLLQTLSPRPIVPQDFALLAQSVDGVHRAVAIDLLDPVTPDTNSPRSVTVAVVAEDGSAVGPSVKAAVDQLLQDSREVNFQVFVIDPTYVTINVDVQVTVLSGFSENDVLDSVISAVEDYLSPANWGRLQDDAGFGWINQDRVRYLEVASVVNAVPGVDYIVSLELNGDPYGSDVVLSGYAPLTEPGTITASV